MSGRRRDPAAERAARIPFYRTLATVYDGMGLPRARNHAREVAGISAATASRLIGMGWVPRAYLDGTCSPKRLAFLDQCMQVYAAAYSRKSSRVGRLAAQAGGRSWFSSLNLKGCRKRFALEFWRAVSRARGIAAMVVGWDRATFGQPVPQVYPSWIDRFAPDADELRAYYPPSSWRVMEICTQSVVKDVCKSMRGGGRWWPDEITRWMDWWAHHWFEDTYVLRYEEEPWNQSLQAEKDEFNGALSIDQVAEHARAYPYPIPVTDVEAFVERLVEHLCQMKLRADGLGGERHLVQDREIDRGYTYWLYQRAREEPEVMVCRGRRILGRCAFDSPHLWEGQVELDVYGLEVMHEKGEVRIPIRGSSDVLTLPIPPRDELKDAATEHWERSVDRRRTGST